MWGAASVDAFQQVPQVCAKFENDGFIVVAVAYGPASPLSPRSAWNIVLRREMSEAETLAAEEGARNGADSLK